MLKERYQELLSQSFTTQEQWDARNHELKWLNREMGRLGKRQLYRQKNSRELFMNSKGYIIHDPDGVISCQSLYEQYCIWCREHAVTPHSVRGLTLVVKHNMLEYRLVPTQNIPSPKGTHIRGYRGLRLWQETDGPAQRIDPEDLPRTYIPPEPVREEAFTIWDMTKKTRELASASQSEKMTDHTDISENTIMDKQTCPDVLPVLSANKNP